MAERKGSTSERHDAMCEAEFIGDAKGYTGCGCALRALAPEMLEALQDAVARIHGMADWLEDNGRAPLARQLRRDMDPSVALIARANGARP
jgi:hypothetical protein